MAVADVAAGLALALLAVVVMDVSHCCVPPVESVTTAFLCLALLCE
jgi:hypothetical protein